MRNFDIINCLRIPLKYDVKQSGIYCIFNRISNKFYIGSSIHCYHRVKGHHFARLKNKTHTNPHLQAAYNQYGKDAFDSFIIELCDSSELTEIEQLYIDNTGCINNSIGYNINIFADRVVLTVEQREKIKQAKTGKKRPLWVRQKIAKAQIGRKWTPTQRAKYLTTIAKIGFKSKGPGSAGAKKGWETRRAKQLGYCPIFDI